MLSCCSIKSGFKETNELVSPLRVRYCCSLNLHPLISAYERDAFVPNEQSSVCVTMAKYESPHKKSHYSTSHCLRNASMRDRFLYSSILIKKRGERSEDTLITSNVSREDLVGKVKMIAFDLNGECSIGVAKPLVKGWKACSYSHPPHSNFPLHI